ncbi:MAG TPA: hypothetical protein VHQ03_12815 [Candidatus Dormibacteraeota bacterium]|nr:hypothetical protein [Candidatus Dormibacteraeota bacterium]
MCLSGIVPVSMVMVVGSNGTLLYDVSDALHPRAVCRITNTYARILTGTSFEYLVPHADGTTDVVLHALGSNNESVESRLQADLSSTSMGIFFANAAWAPGRGVMAYLAPGGTDANGSGIVDVWVATSRVRTKISSYSVPGIDGFGRPGPPPPTLAMSPDGAYLAAGWSIAPTSIHVFRLSDSLDVTPTMPAGLRFGFWSRTGHTLYLVGSAGVEEWTSEAGVAAVAGTGPWTLGPNFSPDGTQVVFTGFGSAGVIRVSLYDLKTRSSRQLIDQPRSSPIFVRAGWVWYFEEKTCVVSADNPCFDPTTPDGNILAADIATGQESQLSFAPGESPTAAGTFFMTPVDVWPLA